MKGLSLLCLPGRWGRMAAVVLSLCACGHMTAAAKAKKPPPGPAWGEQARVTELAEQLSQSHDLPKAWVIQQIARAHPVPKVRQLVMPPATPTAKNWHAYRERFIEPKRIAAGVEFWRRHDKALRRAQAAYGVPPEMVVGIIGVETYYGRHLGKFPVLDVLTTLSLDFPLDHPRALERQAFFRSELGFFLKQARQGASLKRQGSYAGAMGWPQFMPSSWSRHAVDFDGDGQIDLNNSPVDAIGSVANYFANHGWKSGMPTHFAVDVSGPGVDLATLTAPDIVPTFTAERMTELGARLDEAGRALTGPLALVELQNGGNAPSYIAGTSNFYTVTRYNWSSYYAMAVIELGQAVKAAMGLPVDTPAPPETMTLSQALKGNRHVLLMRHAHAPGVGDPPGYSLARCESQRTLNEEGKSQATRIGQWLREQGVTQARVLSSVWCRCQQTAERLNLGSVEVSPALASFFDDPAQAPKRQQELADLIAQTLPVKGHQALILVTHHVNIRAFMGRDIGSGDMVLAEVNPQGQMINFKIYPSP
jgi:membrane-bound lytic murein transglycosylase B